MSMFQISMSVNDTVTCVVAEVTVVTQRAITSAPAPRVSSSKIMTAKVIKF